MIAQAVVAHSATDWKHLVDRVQTGDASAVEALYRRLSMLRWQFYQHLGPDCSEDLFHETVLDVWTQVASGALRDPSLLLNYARRIASHKIAGQVRSRMFSRNTHQCVDDALYELKSPDSDPEEDVIREEQKEIALRILSTLPQREREVLVRFYLQEQTAEQIQADFGLSDTQFRLVKSRAKVRFTELCKARLAPRKPARRASAKSVSQKCA